MTKELKTIDIKGKAYVEVHERIRYFRETYPDGQILTELISNKDGVCIIKATVIVGEVTVATGHAYEVESASYINKTSYIENCETSAIGRALGIFGIGIDSSVASADEVAIAISKQEALDKADMSNSTPVKEKPSSSAAAPSDMKADERSQILDGSYQMPFGRNKGVALMDLATSEIESTITYMEGKLVPGKWYKANAAKIEAFKQYLDKRVNSEATGDEIDDDEVPF